MPILRQCRKIKRVKHMKHKIAYLAIATAIAASSSFVMANPTVGTSSTQIQVKGSKGGNYGFTLTMEEEDVMYYDAQSKTFLSQKPNGLRGVVSLVVPSAGTGVSDPSLFTLKAALDSKVANANKLLFKKNGVFENSGITLATHVAGLTLTSTPQTIDMEALLGHPLDADTDGAIDPIVKEPVFVSLTQDQFFGVADGDALKDGIYEGHADIEWTASFGS